jgi:class 3 adenylate cyclase/tetratricopeptide (TPR) repeat protein
MPSCTSCGYDMPPGARFCPSCGAAADAGRAAPEERRVVTVLFADLVGYTSLAEHLDPENVKLLIDSCFRRLVYDIEDFGGRVDKLLGDAIVALFGAPVAHEDDAERAVRCALRMQRTLTRFVEERAAGVGAGTEIRMRIGINTGEVLVGTLAGTDYTAMGDVVNTAARLQALAPPSGVLIGSATAVLCSAAVSTEPFGVTQLRGRDQVEQSWLVTGAAAGTRHRRTDVPFVGRVSERAMLEAATQIVRDGHSGVVSIVGEAGMGKTRLADEMVASLDDGAIVVRTACAPYGELSPWSPVVTGITGLFGFDQDASTDEIRQVVEAKAAAVWGLNAGDEELERYLDVIFHLLGHPSHLDRVDAAGARDAVASAVVQMLSGHTASQFTVVVVDDLQWADPLLRDLLAVVVRSLGNRPFMLVTTERPDPDLSWPPPVDRPLVVQVPLGPLRRDEALCLVSNIIEEQNAATVDALVERGGGNPLFLVELAALADSCESGSDLPGSLRALIAARIDQLLVPQRSMLDNAAVLGHRGPIGALATFAREMGQDFDIGDLDELASTGLLEVDGKWWQFGSDVVREVAYQTLTKRVRAQRHAGVAAVLAARGAGIDDVAHHAATAAELYVELGSVPGVRPSIIDHAIEALREAAIDALDTARYEAAVRHASRALDFHRASSLTERRLLLVRATAETEQRRFAAARADATAVLESAIADGDRSSEGEARRRLGTLAQLQGDLASARHEMDAAIEVFRALGDEAGLANALRSRGFAEVFGGSLTEARRYLDQAMQRFTDLDDERGLAWTHQNQAWVAFQAGDFADAQVQLAEARARFDELGDHTGVAWAAGLQAWVWYFQRQFTQAEELAQQVEAESRKWGDAWPMLMMQTLLANLRLWTGRLTEAEQIAERALAGFRELDDRYGVMQALGPLNRARAALGKQADAKRGLEESIALGDSFGELAMALQTAAGVTMHLGLGEQTTTLAEQVVERNLASGSSVAEASVLLTLGQLQTGDIDAAMATADGLEVEDFPFGRAARALARVLSGDLEGGRHDAALVEEERGASYFDVGLARLAAVLASERDGEDPGALERLSSMASSIGDIGFLAMVQRLQDGTTAAGEPATLSAGWRRIVDAAVVG